jgi:hypothetical protein
MRLTALAALALALAPGPGLAGSLDHTVSAINATETAVAFDLNWAGRTGDAAAPDLIGPSPEAAPIDVLRILLRVAAAVPREESSELRLAHDGAVRFVLPRQALREIGRAYAMGDNPVCLVRALPERLLTPSGLPAFASWSGGTLGILAAPIEDVNRMADICYLDDLRAGCE